MEFHSRGKNEKLAELSLTIEDELKQKAFVESIGALYSAQDTFHSKIAALIEPYAAECERLKPAGESTDFGVGAAVPSRNFLASAREDTRLYTCVSARWRASTLVRPGRCRESPE